MKLDLKSFCVCVFAQYHKNPKFTFFAQNPENIQKLRFFTHSLHKTITKNNC